MKKMTQQESYLHGALCEIWGIVDGLAVIQNLLDDEREGLAERELTDLRAMVCPTLNFTSIAIGKLLDQFEDRTQGKN